MREPSRGGSYGTPLQLRFAAIQLNSRPRKTLNWDTPAQRLDMVINANK